MRGVRLRGVGGSLTLTLLGILALAGTMPRLALSGTLPACLTESPGAASLGLHLSLLTESPFCPEGSFAPGPHYLEVARFSVMLSISTLIAGLVVLLAALGAGVWTRVAVQRARAWVNHRLGVPIVNPGPARHLRAPLGVRIERFHGAVWVSLQLLRGPPVGVAA